MKEAKSFPFVCFRYSPDVSEFFGYSPLSDKRQRELREAREQLRHSVREELSRAAPKMKKNQFQCSMCGKIYTKGRRDRAAWREYKRNFPGASRDTALMVCDGCFQYMVSIHPPPGMRDE